MKHQAFQWQAKVRDYEVDSQGIVNHAIYIHYFEQCRNDFARSIGIDYWQLQQQDYSIVVAKLGIRYLSPLVINDAFTVTAVLAHFDKRRFLVKQTLRHSPSKRLVALAEVSLACINQQTGDKNLPEIIIKHLPPSKCIG